MFRFDNWANLLGCIGVSIGFDLRYAIAIVTMIVLAAMATLMSISRHSVFSAQVRGPSMVLLLMMR